MEDKLSKYKFNYKISEEKPDDPKFSDFCKNCHKHIEVNGKKLKLVKGAKVVGDDYVDLRLHYTFPAPFDQLDLGSCTSNATSNALRCCLSKQKDKDIVPSRLYMYFNARIFNGLPRTQDSGNTIKEVLDAISHFGICDEALYPYIPSKFALFPPLSVYKKAKECVIRYYRVAQKLDELKQALKQGFPIIFGVAIYSSFMSSEVARTGHVPLPSWSDVLYGWHCLAPETEITLDDGITKIQIKDIGEMNNVTTVCEHTLVTTPSGIYNIFSYDPKEKGLKVYEITTISGRKIKATGNHPFLTQRGWVNVDDIDVENDRICINPGIESFVDDIPSSETIILSVDDFVSKLRALGQSDSYIYKQITQLKSKGLLPLMSTNKQLPLLARFHAAVLTDGTLHLEKCRFMARFNLGCREDAENVLKDLKTLGFEGINLRYCETTLHSKDMDTITTYKTFSVAKCGALGSLLYCLGLTYGKKTEQIVNPIPDWIMQGSKLVKREWLAAYHGGDGCAPRYNKRKSENGYRISIPGIKRVIQKQYLTSMLDFCNQIAKLYEEFDIKPGQITTLTYMKADKIIVRQHMAGSEFNMLKFISKVGYRYCKEKENKAKYIGEYIKFKFTEAERKYGPSIYSKKRCRFLPSLNIHQFITNYGQNNGMLFLPILSKVETEVDRVYDFTTVSENHSFIANDFVTHNCVLICGYSEQKKQFLCQNSWGKDWGIEGFFWLPYDYVLNAKLSNDFWTIRSYT